MYLRGALLRIAVSPISSPLHRLFLQLWAALVFCVAKSRTAFFANVQKTIAASIIARKVICGFGQYLLTDSAAFHPLGQCFAPHKRSEAVFQATANLALRTNAVLAIRMFVEVRKWLDLIAYFATPVSDLVHLGFSLCNSVVCRSGQSAQSSLFGRVITPSYAHAYIVPKEVRWVQPISMS